MTANEKLVWAAAFADQFARGRRRDDCAYMAACAVLEMREAGMVDDADARYEWPRMLEEMRRDA